MRKVDVFTHIFPEPYQAGIARIAPDVMTSARMRNIPMLVDLDERFRVMDRFEGYQRCSDRDAADRAYSKPSDAIDLARAANDGMADLVARYPDRFPDSSPRCRSTT
jgi:aminocarboxymuconate-semialdehyde decarboxylase